MFEPGDVVANIPEGKEQPLEVLVPVDAIGSVAVKKTISKLTYSIVPNRSQLRQQTVNQACAELLKVLIDTGMIKMSDKLVDGMIEFNMAITVINPSVAERLMGAINGEKEPV